MVQKNYRKIYRQSIESPEHFWGQAAKNVHWFREWDCVLDDSRAPFYRWFTGAETNTCYNCLDRQVENGRGEQTALIYDSAITGRQKKFTYRELLDKVAIFAGTLAGMGVAKGDRVIIYMPMVPEAAIAMLACARIGAIHSVVFGGFAARELATRIDDAKPKVIVSASCGIEPSRLVLYKPLLDEAISIASEKPHKCIILQRQEAKAQLIPGRDIDWKEAIADAQPADYVKVKATDPLYIIYTSGTTGEPKGIVRDNGGHLVALEWSMANLFNVKPGEVFWAASDIGWVVGHSYIVYGPLLHGCTSILFEGKPVGTPDAGVYWRVISEHKVVTVFTAPTAIRAIKREDPEGKLLQSYDLSHFRALFLAGERADTDTLRWAGDRLDAPVIDHWWQTESGWPMAANCLGLGQPVIKYGSVARAVPGYDIRIVDESGDEMERGQMGAIVIKLPLPPGNLPTLWNADDRFIKAYLERFPGFYHTGDAGYMDDDGYLFVMSRTDDIINVAGHRLSTGAMEEVLARHPDVAECAVTGVADSLKGQVPLGFLVLKNGVNRDTDDIAQEAVKMIRKDIGPVAAFKKAIIVDRLPKTRSGKVLRSTMQKIADNQPYKIPATIEDPAVLEEITKALLNTNPPSK